MELSELIPDGKTIRLRANTRDDAIRELVAWLVTRGALPEDHVETAVKALLNREQIGSTAIGNSVAVPHARTQFPCELVVCCGVAPQGIDWSGTPVKVIFLVLSAVSATARHLQTLAKVATLVRNSAFVDDLLHEHDVDMT